MKEAFKVWLQAVVCGLQSSNDLPPTLLSDPVIERCKDPEHGDFATNLAMVLAKKAGMSPRQLAEMMVRAVPLPALFQTVSIAGPGFINVRVCPQHLADALMVQYGDERLGVVPVTDPETIVVDYSSPNLAKEMHVGHLRTTIIGDALVRVLSWMGHRVVRQNHVGDWGTQFGMLLAFIEQNQWDDMALLTRQLSDLEVFYKQAKQAFDASEAFAARAREMVVKLQQGDSDCLRLWALFSKASMQHCQDVYAALHVLLCGEDVRGESAYASCLPEIIADLAQQGLLRESDGAKVVFSETLTNKDDQPLPLLVEKKGGGYLYATTDLAALRYRIEHMHADRILYVVDQRQALHFEQIFEVAARMPWRRVACHHVGFGTVNGKDGKPFKTRDGGTTKLMDLITRAKHEAAMLVAEKNPAMSDVERQNIADVLAISAIKYADLSKVRTSDYVFDFKSMLSFEGNTAPYLLYAYARLHQLLAKAPDVALTRPTLTNDTEQALAHHLLAFSERVTQVATRHQPHVLCQYLYDLATLLMQFYERCPILKADATDMASRLLLCRLSARVLKQGLALLGITTLDRM